VTILDISYYFQTSVNSNFFWSIGCSIDKKTNMQSLRIFQNNFIRNKKLIKTQNSPTKLLKLLQIQTKIFKKTKKSLKLEIINMIVYNFIPLHGH